MRSIDKDKYTRPDYQISISDLEKYGYKKDNMYPLSKQRAETLFSLKLGIYLLYPNNKEKRVYKTTEIRLFEGFVGIRKTDWEDYLDTVAGKAFLSAWYKVANRKQTYLMREECFKETKIAKKYCDLFFNEINEIEKFYTTVNGADDEYCTFLFDKGQNVEVIGHIIYEYGTRLHEAFANAGYKDSSKEYFTCELLRECIGRVYTV